MFKVFTFLQIALAVFAITDTDSLSIGNSRWRYVSKNVKSPVRFTTNTAIQLDYVSESLTNINDAVVIETEAFWSTFTDGCTIANTSDISATLLCTQQAQAGVQILRSGTLNTTDTFFISVGKPADCYEWHGVFVINDEAAKEIGTQSQSELRIWVHDTSNNILVGNILPTEDDAQLTDAFFSLGELPTMVFTTSNLVRVQIMVSECSYNAIDKYWYANVTASTFTEHLSLIVDGNHVQLLGCQIDSATFQINVVQYAGLGGGSTLTVAPVFNSHHDIISNVCSQNSMAVLISGSLQFYFTQDMFVSTYVLEATSMGAATSITHIALLRTKMVILTNANEIYYVQNISSNGLLLNPTKSVFNDTNIGSITSIHGAARCNTVFSPSFDAMVIAFNKEASVFATKFFISYDYGTVFQPIVMPSSIRVNASVQIVTVTKLVLLVRTDTNRDVILSYNIVQGLFTVGYVFGENKLRELDSTPVGLKVGISSTEMLIYGSSLYYSFTGGLHAHKIGHGGGNALLAQEYIEQVSCSGTGFYAIITSTRRLFYGALGLGNVIEIQSGERPNSIVSLMLINPYASTIYHYSQHVHVLNESSRTLRTLRATVDDHHLYMLTMPTTTAFSKRQVPVANAIKSKMIANNMIQDELLCPYVLRQDNLSVHYYLDVHDTIVVTSVLIPNTDTKFSYGANSMSLQLENANMISYHTDVNVQLAVANNIYEYVQVFTLQPNLDIYNTRSDRIKYIQGDTSFTIIPKLTSIACAAQSHVSLVSMGCPVMRRIQVVHDQLSNCDAYKNSDNFDYQKYGCPGRVYHEGASYKPVLQLFDGDTFMEDVAVDFVMFELQGRDGEYYYTSTAQSQGCNRNTINWDNYQDFTGSVSKSSWNSDTHQSCFEPNTLNAEYDSDAHYPIFNLTNGVSIKFTGNHNGIFLFEVNIVNPDYSFCLLRTFFAIEVYGAPVDALTSILVIIIGSVIIAAFLALTYVYYRQTKRNEREKIKNA